MIKNNKSKYNVKALDESIPKELIRLREEVEYLKLKDLYQKN